MDVKGVFEKFKKQIKISYPDILVGFEEIEEYYRVYYYLKGFNIKDMNFHKIMGTAILETFYENGIFNLGQTFISLEEAKKVFPELNKEIIISRMDLTKDENRT